MVFVDAYLVAVFIVVCLVVDLCRGLSSLIGKVGTIRELPVLELREISWSRADEMVMGEKHRTDAPGGSPSLLCSATYSRQQHLHKSDSVNGIETVPMWGSYGC